MYKHNIQVCWCNYCCHGKAISIAYECVCVSVAFVIQYAKCMHHILSSVACLAIIFPHYLVNSMFFSWKVIELKICILILSTTLSKTFLILKRIEVDITNLGARSGSVGWGTVIQAGRSQVYFTMVSLQFFIDNLLAQLWPWVRLSLLTEISVRNIFLGGGHKGCCCIGLTTLQSLCAHCLEIWEPHPPGTLRVCPDLCRDCFTVTINVHVNYPLCLSYFN
jgi:hypothetical protein